MSERERVTGIGGVFFKSSDVAKLRAWYAEHLGLQGDEFGVFFTDGGPIVWSAFRADTTYFGPESAPFMINYRVRDLDKMLAQLRDAGVQVADKIEDQEGIGRFGWAVDPEGHRFELWEPEKKSG